MRHCAGAQFYISESDVGQNRAEVSVKQVAELNPTVNVQASSLDLASADLSFLDQFKVTTMRRDLRAFRFVDHDSFVRLVRHLDRDAAGVAAEDQRILS